ncbi:ferritin-like domain-containing protein [Magnetospira thiophila]
MRTDANTLAARARAILLTPEPSDKAAASLALAESWRQGQVSDSGHGEALALDRPARPETPELLHPRHMPRRGKGGLSGRIALLHAIAHIEFNAIDLAWDLIVRFGRPDLPRAFYDDWVLVAEDEARHFALLAARLAELGAAYGDLPAHDGLWEAATNTADDLLARLALVPMVLEARGLDTTPGAVARLNSHGDRDSAEILALIGAEEERHVAAGVRWFRFECARRGRDPVPTFQDLVRQRFPGRFKPPFNGPARDRAGLEEAFYLPLVGS